MTQKNRLPAPGGSLDRRQFIARLLAISATGALAGLSGCAPRPASPMEPVAVTAAGAGKAGLPTAAAPAATAAPTVAPAAAASAAPAGAAQLAVARIAGADPGELVRRALAALGGIERFVRPGADVIVKPNICNAYHGPEYASTTNPEVVAALVALCLGAGARRVRVLDYPFAGAPQAAYASSGIQAAAEAAGAAMETIKPMRFRQISLPEGRALRAAEVYGDVLDADVVINVPIAKTHGGARLTLGMKNLMGVVQDRGALHARGLHQCIADLNTAVRPQLTVVDAVRMLMDNGPTGGNLDDVRRADTVIASADIVAADAYAATLFGLQAADIDYIRLAAEMGLGTLDLQSIKLAEISA